jgi:inosine-uridine nucleoside N-ribohydrolase
MDWNVQVDIQSAQHVIERSNPTLIPLTVTVETALRRAYLPALRGAGPLAQLIARQAEAFAKDENMEARFGQTCAGLPADIINFQHDPLASAIALGWNDGVEINEIPLRLEIEDGWLYERVDASGTPTSVVTRVNASAFNEFWLRTVTMQ